MRRDNLSEKSQAIQNEIDNLRQRLADAEAEFKASLNPAERYLRTKGRYSVPELQDKYSKPNTKK